MDVDHTCPATKPLGSPTDRPPINSAFRGRPCARRRSAAAGPVQRETTDRPAYRSLNNRTVSVQEPDVSLLDSLRDHVASLKAENETLKAQFAGAEGRAVAESARAGEECTKTAQAIAAFEGLAQRLEAIAEARRPWWRRLVG